MADASTDRILKIEALSQGNYPDLTRAAIVGGSTIDQFGMDLLTVMNREPVTIATGQDLPAGSILIRAYSTSVDVDPGNTGDGLPTDVSIGPEVIEGIFTVTCTDVRTNRGIFEVRSPSNGILGEVNVGTPFECAHLRLTIADGSTDFAVGDGFTITVTGGTYSGYDYDAAELAEVSDLDPPVQIAGAVLALPVNTVTPPGAQEQFAIVRGPAILPSGFVQLGNSPWNANHYQNLQDFAMATSLDQLARRGIVIRG